MKLKTLIICLFISACTRGKPPRPTIIHVPAEPRPVRELLQEIGENTENPIIARSRNISINHNQLVQQLLLKYSESEVKNLICRETGLLHVRRNGIEIDAREIELRAKEILQFENLPLEFYLKKRGIDKVTWVNEISIELSFEQLCRYELIKYGARQIEAAVHESEQSAQENGLKNSETNWYAPYLVADFELRDVLFSTEIPKIVENNGKYFTIKMLRDIPPTSINSPDFQVHLERLQKWKPSEATMEIFLNHLVKEEDVSYLWDRIKK